MDFAMLRNTQGIHMPLKLQMEKNVAQKVSVVKELSLN
jgi:hypothetical protein